MCLLATVLISGCSQKRENVQMPQSFVEKKGTIAIGQMTGLEEPQYAQVGNQGLLDLAINHMMTKSVKDKLKEVDAKPIVEQHYYKPFMNAFNARSFKIVKMKEPIKKENLVKLSNSNRGNKYAPYDFKFLKNSNNSDYALILNPHTFGLWRSYGRGFVPGSNPLGYAHLTAYLVDLSNNSIIGECQVEVQEHAMGEWDTPPDYTALMKSSKKALKRALEDVYAFFFDVA